MKIFNRYSLKHPLTMMSVILAVSGISIFTYQIYHYFKTGNWEKISFLDFVVKLSTLKGTKSEISEIAQNPESWWGFHKFFFSVFDFISLALLLVIIGTFLTMISFRGQYKN